MKQDERGWKQLDCRSLIEPARDMAGPGEACHLVNNSTTFLPGFPIYVPV